MTLAAFGRRRAATKRGILPSYILCDDTSDLVASLNPVAYSLPFYGPRRLARDVQGDAVDAGDLVDDAVGDLLQQVVGQAGSVCRHRVVGGDGPDHDGVRVGSGVAHDRSEEHTSGLQSRQYLGCRLLLEKKIYL